MVFRALICAVLAAALVGCAGSWEQSKTPQRTPRVPSSSPVASGIYTVKPGDTFYSIAFRHNVAQADLARWNRISDATRIYPGQKLRLTAPPNQPVAKTPVRRAPIQSVARWRWPTEGRLVSSFDLSKKVKQTGILISGQRGQPIFAAAGGEVVYAGSGLKGYGKLVIIQHTPNYLSAYGHNAALLVNEGDQVGSGQKIATMGETAAQKPRLHFEIRKDGQPVDPMPFLRQ
ncbi:MAG: peptidoglycan DD-metalloendopeptidase family protein [Pseudomonadota bacterium]